MITIESAFERGDYDAARLAVGEQFNVLRGLHDDGQWTEEQIHEFLSERGLVRSINDLAYQQRIGAALRQTQQNSSLSQRR